MTDIRRIDGQKSVLQGVLVIASAGRMLAHAVRQAGYSPLVIDLFADQDTDAIAEQLWQVDNFSLAVVQAVIERLLLSYKIQWVIYGSGLENQPETLAYLTEHFNVTGNDSSLCRRLNCKQSFFKQLDLLEVCHPDVQFYPPKNSTGWLIKPVKHAGGVGISWCDRAAGDNEYYQRFCQGEAGSVLFCANGEQYELIGFHRQWTVNQDNFAFAGIINEAFLPEKQQQIVRFSNLKNEDLDAGSDVIVELLMVLEKYNMHFGYRVADEMARFIILSKHSINKFNWKESLDIQILQKVLPKLHGTRAKLEDPIKDLIDYCNEHGFTRSEGKLKNMQINLDKNGYASFIE